MRMLIENLVKTTALACIPSYCNTPSVSVEQSQAKHAFEAFVVWSGPSLSAARIIGYHRMHQWKAISWWFFAHAHDNVNPHILRKLENTFLIDVAQL